MTDDETIALGEYCEDLMRQENFNVLVQQFELQCFQHIMTTAPHETKTREGVFAKYCGLRDFLGHVKACVEQKNDTLLKIEALSKPDAQKEIEY